MSAPIVCAECGIRYGDTMDACPWCGRAQAAAPPPVPPVAQVRPEPASQRAPTIAPPAPPPRLPPPAAGGVPTAAARPAGQPAPAPPSNGQVQPAAAQANLVPAPPAPATARPEPAWRDPVRLKHAGVWVAAVVGCLVLGALIAEFAPLGLLRGGSDEPADLQEPLVVDPLDQVEVAPPVEEAPPPTVATTVTTLAPEPTAAPGVTPIGDPIALSDLSLSVDGIGELEIGSDADTVLGRLAATFGAPDEDRALVSDGTFSGCPGEAVRIVRWGTLAVTSIPGSDGEVFAGYRVDLAFAEGDPGPALETISGLRAGDTVAELQEVYAGLDLQFFEATDGPVFELRRPSDGTLLLTGPLTGVDADSQVRGIYSPDLCV